MECFIILHAKNKNEKMEILQSFHDNLRYEVTPNLKKYIEQKYKGRFVEGEEDGGGIVKRESEGVTTATETKNIPQIVDIVQNEPAVEGLNPNIVDIIPPIDNTNTNTALDDELPLYAYLNAYTDDVSIDIQENDSHTDDIGMDMPYLDDTMEVEDRGRSPTPSTSTVRRSSRITKTPKSTKKVTNTRQVYRNSRKGAKIECKKCLKMFSANYRNYYSFARDHAIRHTGLMGYKCQVANCGYKCGPKTTVISHMDRKHGGYHYSAKKIELTIEQEKELDKVVKECFPEFETKSKVCQLCKEPCSSHLTTPHSLLHIKLQLYKCNQPNCSYRCKWFTTMANHGMKEHGIEEISKEETKIELTANQKKAIDDIMKRCFPNEEDNEG